MEICSHFPLAYAYQGLQWQKVTELDKEGKTK